jgi:hypothetical protein
MLDSIKQIKNLRPCRERHYSEARFSKVEEVGWIFNFAEDVPQKAMR